MERIAIHIESYKNIKNQTFCFNPKFECKYDENKKKINFAKKKNYINIFPKNINITAIVGKNGTGKSSILKAFLEEIYRLEKKKNNKDIAQYSEISVDNYITIYWDYSITDEGFLEFEPDAKYCIYENNRVFLTLPAKVDNNNDSNIDLHKDIQNLARNILKIDNIDILIKDFFDIDKILILGNLTSDSEINKETNNIKYFSDTYGKELKKGKNNQNIYVFNYSKNNIDLIHKEIDKIKLIDFISKDHKKLLFLSFGEIQLLKILCNIQSLINNITNDDKNILFLLDELELGLHPQWQKKIINLLSKMKTKKNKKVYFVLTSHSPFILSDIPKDNIIFLDKFDDKTKEKYSNLDTKDLENGSCINVSKHIKLKTFGANIHTLLSNGFFMSDGLMGEFAKSKITEILKFLNDKEKLKTIKKEQIKPIIESIGEDFLRNKLLNLYRKKLTEDEKEKEKLILRNKIDELQKQYNELNK
ncbi:AAA family ATPase [Aliarcobacter butzleri]|uniref:AAA family ATPase n=1 Tax=Aliarcobacter butzleri TaxID=28197 RepID=UPI00263F2B2A|nr:AAA family ATPase [Aliarcobacter butzleri]MDN5110910.1 AAA family ATPase [Aliarcobacter butzleri]